MRFVVGLHLNDQRLLLLLLLMVVIFDGCCCCCLAPPHRHYNGEAAAQPPTTKTTTDDNNMETGLSDGPVFLTVSFILLQRLSSCCLCGRVFDNMVNKNHDKNLLTFTHNKSNARKKDDNNSCVQ